VRPNVDLERSRKVTEYESRPAEPQLSGWATAGITFAATMMFIIGVFQIIAGLAAIFDDDFYVITANYAFDLDTSAWGWVHLIIGVLLLVAAWGLYSGAAWAVVTAIVLASLSAIANFFFIPYYPFWSLLIIALDIWVIWALTRPGAARA
jgi:hypothetical protein